VASKLCTEMKALDVNDTLERALKTFNCKHETVRHKPRLLPDNGASYVSVELANWLDGEFVASQIIRKRSH
jgi:putative transposase